jgi:tetratricopeptide (TPR) repeat protein
MPDLFISHATADDAAAEKLADALTAAGKTAWIDHRGGLTVGMPNWDSEIRKAIGTCAAGLLLMSPRSLVSDICNAECLLIRELGKPLYVAYLETCAPADIWLSIKLLQYADLRENFEAGTRKLIDALNGLTSPGTPTAVTGKITGGDTMRLYLPYLNNVPLTGRDADMTAIRGKLGAHVTQIIAVGGAGKSRLAAEIALSYPNGAIWHRCSPTSAAYEVTEAIRQHYGLDEKTPDHLVLAALDSAPPLIVLDNAEDVEAGSDRRKAYTELCGRLGAHRAPILLTSRAAWDELKPRVQHLPAPLHLDAATRIALDFAAAEMLDLPEANARELAEAARLHPRLIEFAVRQLHERRRERVLRLLRDLEHEELQDVLEEMIRRTVRQMVAEARYGADAETLLRRLTACRGVFDMHAISALRPDGMDEDTLDDALTTLQRWGFLRRVEHDRYSIDDVTTSALPPDDDACARHFAYYSKLHGDYDANNNEDRHPLIERDWPNVRAALEWGWGGSTEAAVDFVHALRYYMSMRVSNAEWRAVTEDAYREAVRIGYQWGQANTLKALGDVAYMQDEYAEARTFYDRALPVFEQIGDRLGQANTLKALGDVARMLSEYAEARTFYDRALPVFEQIGARIGQANTLKALGDVAYMLSEYAEARTFYDRALTLYEQIGDRIGQANTLKALGDVALQQNEYAKARTFYDRALTLGKQLGNFTARLNSLNGLARLEKALGNTEVACDLYRRLLALAETHTFFAHHPVVESWRREYAEMGCDGTAETDNEENEG